MTTGKKTRLTLALLIVGLPSLVLAIGYLAAFVSDVFLFVFPFALVLVEQVVDERVRPGAVPAAGASWLAERVS